MIYVVIQIAADGRTIDTPSDIEHDTYEDAQAEHDALSAEHPDRTYNIQAWDI